MKVFVHVKALQIFYLERKSAWLSQCVCALDSVWVGGIHLSSE